MKKAFYFIACMAAFISISSCGDSQSNHSTAAAEPTEKSDNAQKEPIVDTAQKIFITEYFHKVSVIDSVENDKDHFVISLVFKNGVKKEAWFHASDAWKKGGSGDIADSPAKTSRLKKLYEEIKKAKASDFYARYVSDRLLMVGILEKSVEGKDGAAGTYVPAKIVWIDGYPQI